jgi:hypothetical protein
VPESREIDARVDDMHFALGVRNLRLELAPEKVGNGDHRVRSAHRRCGRGRHARDGADVANVAAVRGENQVRADPSRREGRSRARREEEMRVDDVGMKPARLGERASRQASVLGRRAAPVVDHHAGDVVSGSLELVRELLYEDAEVGSRRAGIHLRNEQDTHVDYC